MVREKTRDKSCANFPENQQILEKIATRVLLEGAKEKFPVSETNYFFDLRKTQSLDVSYGHISFLIRMSKLVILYYLTYLDRRVGWKIYIQK